MLYVLKLLPIHPSNPQWSSGYRDNRDSCVVGSNSTVFRISFFSFHIEETCTFMNIYSLKYHLMGERGYGRWDLMLTVRLRWIAQIDVKR